jgi:hypothetical protein
MYEFRLLLYYLLTFWNRFERTARFCSKCFIILYKMFLQTKIKYSLQNVMPFSIFPHCSSSWNESNCNFVQCCDRQFAENCGSSLKDYTVEISISYIGLYDTSSIALHSQCVLCQVAAPQNFFCSINSVSVRRAVSGERIVLEIVLEI